MDNETKLTTQLRRTRAEISQIVAAFAGSGVSRTEFCRRHRIGLGTLNRYLKQQGRESDTGSCGLIAVELAGSKFAADGDRGGILTVVLARGRRVEVGPGFDTPTLERLVLVLEKV